MRQFRNLIGRPRWEERGFNEAQIMKFTMPDGQDDLTSRIFVGFKSPADTTPIRAITTAEPEPQRAFAKGASA